MNKIKKAIQCMKYKRIILGKVGNNNRFELGTRLESTCEVGNENYFSFRVMVGNAIIGNYCSFGPDVKIGQSQHSIDYFTTCQKVSSKTIGHSMLREKTKIGNDVWIGANAVVMQGVKIGNGAVIGANAVVTKDVPDFAIAVGVPSRIIKYRFSEDKIKKIENSNWWNKEFDDACRILIELNENI